jgi:Ca2+ transporting ATPase
LNEQKNKEEALLSKFQNSEANKYVELKIDDVCVDLFADIFKMDNILNEKSMNLYEKIGKQEGLLRNLEVPFKTGLVTTDPKFIDKRAERFGKNIPIVREPKTLYELVIESLEDQMLRILLAAAFVSFVIGVAQQGWAHGWIEGFSIFMAVFLVVTISSYLNMEKEKQFQKLNKENEKKSMNVRRDGKKTEIMCEDILVGDIIYLDIGNVISCDSIILEGQVEVDESSLTGESDKIIKNANKNPFLICGSMITDGSCEAIVCTVGHNTSSAKTKLQLQEKQDQTPLQEKLEVLADQISNLGIAISIIIFAVMVGKEALNRMFYTHQTLFDSSFLDVFINSFIIAVTVIAVAIPEGLPVAVTIALAFSVLKMKEENNLVRHLDASETMGNVNNICTDKTGTLTEGNMFVRSLFFEGADQLKDKSKPKNIFSDFTNNNSIFIKSIVNNITAYIENKVNIRGNSTECALVRFLVDSGVELEKFTEKGILKWRIPFKSENKYMGSIYYNKENKLFSVYIKGAPEILFNFCDKSIVDKNGNENFTRDVLNTFNTKQNEYANRCERTLAFIHCEFNESFFENIKSDNLQQIFDKVLDQKKFNLIGMVGIADPPREDVPQAIKTCIKAGVTVRMVTGDNINTALAISREIGILSDYEYNLTKQRDLEHIGQIENLKFYALEGRIFREISGGYKEIVNKDSKERKYVLNDIDKFSKAVENIKVIARASPQDKFLLVLGLKEMKNIVAVTGDGTNDAPALKKSDVGLAMGKKGTDIAKDASDIVLLNDSFSSVVTSIKFGRNVYDCIRKFIQFQLTANVVAVFMTLLGGIVLKDAPLNAIQMLWVNLIMDSLASLALATGDPSEELLNRRPYPREEHMITNSMMRNIIVQAIHQVFILSIFIFFGDKFFGVPSDRSLSHFEWNNVNGYHFTLFFNIFVFLQVFNSVNARKLEQKELNVFEGILDNNIYLGVQAFIVLGQIIMVQYGGRALRTHPLTFKQHLACIIVASSSLIASYVGKKIEYMKEEKLPNENDIVEKINSIKIIDRLPSRGKSFRGESRKSLMPVSNKI